LVLLDWVNESHGYVQVSRKGFQVRDRRYILETLTEQIGSRIADWRLTLSDISLVEKLEYPFLPWPLTPFWPHVGELKRLGGEVCFISAYQKQKHREFLRGDVRVSVMRIDGKRIWHAVGHKRARQFQYWQEGSDKATDVDDRSFRRILDMPPAEFIALLKRKGIAPSNS
jgi:hypothetical protein